MITFPASVQYANPFPFGPPETDLQMNMRAAASLLTGLAAIQQAKEKKAEDSILARITQPGKPGEIKSVLADLQKQRQDRNRLSTFISAFNPFAEYAGATALESDLRRMLIEQEMRQSDPLYQAQVKEREARTEYYDERAKPEAKAEVPFVSSKEFTNLEKRRKALEKAYESCIDQEATDEKKEIVILPEKRAVAHRIQAELKKIDIKTTKGLGLTKTGPYTEPFKAGNYAEAMQMIQLCGAASKVDVLRRFLMSFPEYQK